MENWKKGLQKDIVIVDSLVPVDNQSCLADAEPETVSTGNIQIKSNDRMDR